MILDKIKQKLTKTPELLTKEEWVSQMTAKDVPPLVLLDLERGFYQSFETYKLPAGIPEETAFAKWIPYILLGLNTIVFFMLIFKK